MASAVGNSRATSLAMTIGRRDLKAREERERLLVGHLPHVRDIAARIRDRLPSHVPLDDLVSAGVLGLIDAVDKFDPRKNVQLKTYAQFRIRGAILDSLRELDWSPRSLRAQARRIEKARHNLSLELGRAASDEELARESGLPLEVFQQLLGDVRGLKLSSLEAQPEDGQAQNEIASGSSRSAGEDPFLICLREEMVSLLLEAMDSLDEKQRQVLLLYYMEELTMKEVGVVLGVGESRVSQIHSSAIAFLQTQLEKTL